MYVFVFILLSSWSEESIHTHTMTYTIHRSVSALTLCSVLVLFLCQAGPGVKEYTHIQTYIVHCKCGFHLLCCVCDCSCLRLKWSLTSWMTRCVMNVTVSSAMESMPHFIAVLWVASSTIVSTAGLQSMLCPANTTTDRSPRTPETDPGQCLFVDTTTDLSPSWSQTVPAINKKCIIAKNSSI